MKKPKEFVLKKFIQHAGFQPVTIYATCHDDEYGKNISVLGAENLTVEQARRLAAYINKCVDYLEKKDEKSKES